MSAIEGLREDGSCPAAPKSSGGQQAVAWSKRDMIHGDDGYPIGLDEIEVHWGATPPDDEGWVPLYTTPQPCPYVVTSREGTSYCALNGPGAVEPHQSRARAVNREGG